MTRLGSALQMAREVTQLRSQQMKLRAVCESEMQRAATDAASGIEGLQLRWRQVLSHAFTYFTYEPSSYLSYAIGATVLS